jgi:hypothetical protein
MVEMGWPAGDFELPEPPTGFALILKGGQRVPVDLRYVERRPVIGHVWRPVIEGKMLDLMPAVVAVDAENWPPATHVTFPTWSDSKTCHEWMERVISNSPVLTQVSARGRIIRKDADE